MGDDTPRALGGWLTGLGHTLTGGSGDDPVVTAWRWLAGHQAFEAGQAGARCVMRRLADGDAADAWLVLARDSPRGAVAFRKTIPLRDVLPAGSGRPRRIRRA